MKKHTTIGNCYESDKTPDRCYVTLETVDGGIDNLHIHTEEHQGFMISGGDDQDLETYIREIHALLGAVIDDLDQMKASEEHC